MGHPPGRTKNVHGTGRGTGLPPAPGKEAPLWPPERAAPESKWPGSARQGPSSPGSIAVQLEVTRPASPAKKALGLKEGTGYRDGHTVSYLPGHPQLCREAPPCLLWGQTTLWARLSILSQSDLEGQARGSPRPFFDGSLQSHLGTEVPRALCPYTCKRTHEACACTHAYTQMCTRIP